MAKKEKKMEEITDVNSEGGEIFTELVEAAKKLGWGFLIEKSGDQIRGVIIGIPEYLEELDEKLHITEN